MSDGSSIEWTDATWTIAVGCTRCSRGCDNCYAATFVHRGLHPTHKGLTIVRPKSASRPGVDWNGTVRTLPGNLSQPMRWKKPRRVFVGSMTDLFHHAIPFEYIAAVFGVMAACPQHTFQVLTKRPARMLEFFAWAAKEWPMPGPKHTALQRECLRRATGWPSGEVELELWPLPNVHLGVSVEDQATADERIPLLLQCPARVHWCSYEPALGPVDFNAIQIPDERAGLRFSALRHQHDDRFGSSDKLLSWLVVGGESGPGARPFDVEWARSVLLQARGLPTRVFVKQLGARPHSGDAEHGWSLCTDSRNIWSFYDRDGETYEMHDRKGKTMADWPADLRVREEAP